MTNNDALALYTASEQTIRSLDHLTSLLMSENSGEVNKGIFLITQTEGAPLLRLYRGAVSRFTVPFVVLSDPTDHREVFAGMNKLMVNAYLAGDVTMPELTLARYEGQGNTIQNLLTTIIVQYAALKTKS